MITDEGLNREQTLKFIENAFRDGAIQSTGVSVTRISPPVSKFAIGGGHSTKKQSVLDKLGKFFDRFFGLS